MRKILTRAISRTTNPATGEVFRSFKDMGTFDIAKITNDLWDSYKTEFRDMDWDTRSGYLQGVRENLEDNREAAARIMTLEMGKPIAQSYAEVDKCIGLMNFFIEEGEGMISDIKEPFGVTGSSVAFEPIGMILQLAPFNFPFWQVIRFCFPALVAGNVIMVRHSSTCPENGLLLERIFQVENYPSVYKNVFISRQDVSNLIEEDSRVRGVAFTGSTEVGRIIASQAGKALKKSVLELGGSDPFIVMEDANLIDAAECALLSRVLVNSGQACNAAKRILVQSSVKDEFLGIMSEMIEGISFGDPFEELSQIGPMAREDLRNELHEQVQRGLDEGASLICGGGVPENGGFFIEPTLICDVSPEIPSLFFEETFGPAMCVCEFDTLENAIDLSNLSEYGLCGTVFTEDSEKGEFILRHLEVGLGFMNKCASSHWALPFGGFPGKSSGYGRECGIDGLKEWCNVKTLWI